MTGSQFTNALLMKNSSLVPSISKMSTALSERLLMLNVFYDELKITKMEESAKTALVDLIASMGGTLVILNLIY
jgi:hypothetical protein